MAAGNITPMKTSVLYKWGAFMAVLAPLLLLLQAGCGRGGADSAYFPLKTGAKWSYTDGRGRHLETAVTGTRRVGAQECFMVRSRLLPDGPVLRTEYLAWTPAGLARYRVGIEDQEVNLAPPEILLATPLSPNRGWKWEGKLGTDGAKVSASVVGMETQQVMGKPLACLKVRSLAEVGGGLQVTTTRWYVPDLGMVREESTTTTVDGSTSQVLTLENYQEK